MHRPPHNPSLAPASNLDTQTEQNRILEHKHPRFPTMTAESNFRPWTCFIVYFFFAIAKSPSLVLEPRFWAEEGASFYAFMQDASLMDSLAFVHLGTVLGATNLIVYLSTLVPIEYAPMVTSYAALTIQSVVAFQIGRFSDDFSINTLTMLQLVLAWSLLPAAYEVWMTATNIQWVFAVSLLFLSLLPLQTITRRPFLISSWAVVCGLSGVPGLLGGGVLLFRYILTKSAALIWPSAVLILVGVMHAAIILAAGVNRPFIFDPAAIAVATLLQTVLSPLLGVDFVNILAPSIRLGSAAIIAGTLALGVIVLYPIIAIAMHVGDRKIVISIIVAWVAVTAVQCIAGLDPPIQYVSGWHGARYFLFGSVCFCIILALGTTVQNRCANTYVTLVLLMICVIGIVQRSESTWTSMFFVGPSWGQQVRACRAAKTDCDIAVWPNFPGWSVKVRRGRL